MAFAFFRRRRKLVIFVMVFLMLTFLLTLGGGGDEIKAIIDQVGVWFGGHDPNVMGKSSVGKLTWKEHQAARSDEEVLKTPLAAQLLSQLTNAPRIFQQLEKSTGDRGDMAAVAWMLLVKEAQKAGLDTSLADAKSYAEGRMKKAAEGMDLYGQWMTQLRAGQPPVSEAAFLQVVAHWISVEQYFNTQVPSSPPLMSQQLATYRDLTEQANLRVVALEARAFAEKAGTPADDEISTMFQSYKANEAGKAAPGNPYAFGYRYGNRVQLRTLRVNGEAIRRVSTPDTRELAEYYAEHKTDFYSLVPDTQPASRPGATTQAASRPAMKVVLKDFFESRPLIIEVLRPAVAAKRVEEIAARLAKDAKARQDELAASLAAKKTPADQAQAALAAADPLGKVAAAQQYDPEANKALLARELPAKIVNAIRDVTLEQAMPMLAEAAGLAAIAYPYGLKGQTAISPAALVRLSCPEGKTMTLAAALDEVGRQVLPRTAATAGKPAEPKLEWCVFRDVGDPKTNDGLVLFCTGSNVGLRFVPFEASQTELLDQAALTRDAAFRDCQAGREQGDSLADLALAGLEKKDEAATQVGQLGKEMYIVPTGTGDDESVDRLLWQLVKAEPAHTPDALTPAIREQVVADWQTRTAMEKLLPDLARKLSDESKTAGLAEAAKKLQAGACWDTGMFSRKDALFIPQAQGFRSMVVLPLDKRVERMSPEFLEQALRKARRGDLMQLGAVLSETQYQVLQASVDEVRKQAEAVADQLSPADASLKNQLQRAVTMYSLYRDPRPLFKLAGTSLPGGQGRIGGNAFMMLQLNLSLFDMAIESARRWDMDSLGRWAMQEAKALWLLARIKPAEQVQKLLAAAFAVPTDIEVPVGDLDKPGPVQTMPVPESRMVLVFQRIGYRPPTAAGFTAANAADKPSRQNVEIWLAQQRRDEAFNWWFNAKTIPDRLQFKRD